MMPPVYAATDDSSTMRPNPRAAMPGSTRRASWKRGAQVHRVQPVPLLERDLLDAPARRVDARVGDEDIDRPELGLDRVDERVGGGGVGEVGAGGGRAAAARPDLVRDRRRCG